MSDAVDRSKWSLETLIDHACSLAMAYGAGRDDLKVEFMETKAEAIARSLPGQPIDGWFVPPFHYVAMPINAEGDGPETDESKVVMVQHQVWDGAFLPVATCPSEAAARHIANLLNRLRPPAASDDDELEAARGDVSVAGLLQQWQTDQSEWFTSPTLEIVAEYAAWRERKADEPGPGLQAAIDQVGKRWRQWEGLPTPTAAYNRTYATAAKIILQDLHALGFRNE